MNKIFAGVDVGKKNIIFGIVLFLILGVVVGTPLTVGLLGGSMLTESQYQTWKVLHAYGVFTAFVNIFFGFLVDRMNLRQTGARNRQLVIFSGRACGGYRSAGALSAIGFGCMGWLCDRSH